MTNATPELTEELLKSWFAEWDRDIAEPAYQGNGATLKHEEWTAFACRKYNEHLSKHIAAAVEDARRDAIEQLALKARLNGDDMMACFIEELMDE